MPPIGKHLKRVSIKKYGKRVNHRGRGVKECLLEIKPRLASPKFKSDEEPSYGRFIQRIFPNVDHETYPSKRAVIAGQGELKDWTYDPIFPINHTFAMLRANLARLIRRTWSTTKKMSRLSDFIFIYAHMHNSHLVTQAS